MPEMQQRSSLVSSITAAVTGASPATRASEEVEVDPHSPQSIPPWVHINSSDEDQHLLPPNAHGHTVPNSRHYRPEHPPPPSHYRPGRKWDHLRSPSPPFLSRPIAERQAEWKPFIYSGPNPEEQQRNARVVSKQWMDENMPALAQGWREEDDMAVDGSGLPNPGYGFKGLMYKGKWLVSPARQEKTVRIFWRLLLKNPFIPLAFRLTVLAFSAAGLSIAAIIYEKVHRVNTDANQSNNCAPRASTYMAIIVGSVAIPYLGYVTWDEYMSKPLGLRSVAAKTLLLLCDLYFIVFAASNLSLAFDALYDHRWACYDELFATYTITSSSNTTYNYNVPSTCPNNPSICYHQKTLGGILLISLVAWLLTFSLSVMRVVEKLRPD